MKHFPIIPLLLGMAPTLPDGIMGKSPCSVVIPPTPTEIQEQVIEAAKAKRARKAKKRGGSLEGAK